VEDAAEAPVSSELHQCARVILAAWWVIEVIGFRHTVSWVDDDPVQQWRVELPTAATLSVSSLLTAGVDITISSAEIESAVTRIVWNRQDLPNWWTVSTGGVGWRKPHAAPPNFSLMIKTIPFSRFRNAQRAVQEWAQEVMPR
jgi:hypothetical protein